MVKIKRTLAEKNFSVRVLFLQEKTVRYGMIVGKNKIENDKLISLRDTLLPKLMSGELDVSAIDL